ncbi:DUF2975 domain-containing protein [Streptomyces sp. NRRL S-813]|uniref:DUF2975 domain-containing protein n=1 Tax=Streptomyces sp. NRRL S-813 TaxID=1463919 RepID=UPI001F48EBD7|nr:DUF2975 domain-containing protein [Streptomyces sp. NRRL S-813]
MTFDSNRSTFLRMRVFLVVTLQLGITTAILIGLFGQIVIIPGMAADEVDHYPPYAPYSAPYVTVAIVGVACVQVALAAIYMLLDLVRRDAIFTSRSFRWVDTLIGSSIAATVLAFAVTGHVLFGGIPFPQDSMEDLSALATALAGAGVGTASVMLLVILRGLLRKATDRLAA